MSIEKLRTVQENESVKGYDNLQSETVNQSLDALAANDADIVNLKEDVSGLETDINDLIYNVTYITPELKLYESNNFSFLSGIFKVSGGGGAVKSSSLSAPNGYLFDLGAVGTIGTGGYHTQKYADISSVAIDINQSGTASIMYVYKNSQASAFSSVSTDYFNIRVYMPLIKI